jgi:hypothetical protein
VLLDYDEPGSAYSVGWARYVLERRAASSQWAAGESVGLLETTVERRRGRPAGEDPPDADTPDQPIDFIEAIAPLDEHPEETPGAGHEDLQPPPPGRGPQRRPVRRKAYLIHQPVGRGQPIAFAEDPNYRAYAESTALLFMNGVLLGPGR